MNITKVTPTKIFLFFRNIKKLIKIFYLKKFEVRNMESTNDFELNLKVRIEFTKSKELIYPSLNLLSKGYEILRELNSYYKFGSYRN